MQGTKKIKLSDDHQSESAVSLSSSEGAILRVFSSVYRSLESIYGMQNPSLDGLLNTEQMQLLRKSGYLRSDVPEQERKVLIRQQITAMDVDQTLSLLRAADALNVADLKHESRKRMVYSFAHDQALWESLVIDRDWHRASCDQRAFFNGLGTPCSMVDINLYSWLSDCYLLINPIALNYNNAEFTPVCLTSNGRYLLLAGTDSMRYEPTIELIDTSTSEFHGRFSVPLHAQTQFALSNDGCYVTYAGDTHDLWLLSVAENKSTLITGHTDNITAVAFSHDSLHVASGSRDHTIRVHTIETDKTIALEGHAGSVLTIAFDHHGRRIASASDDKSIRVWDLVTQQSTTLHHDDIASGTLIFSPDGTQLAYASSDASNQGTFVIVWDLETNENKSFQANRFFDHDALQFTQDSHDLFIGDSKIAVLYEQSNTKKRRIFSYQKTRELLYTRSSGFYKDHTSTELCFDSDTRYSWQIEPNTIYSVYYFSESSYCLLKNKQRYFLANKEIMHMRDLLNDMPLNYYYLLKRIQAYFMQGKPYVFNNDYEQMLYTALPPQIRQSLEVIEGSIIV